MLASSAMMLKHIGLVILSFHCKHVVVRSTANTLVSLVLLSAAKPLSCLHTSSCAEKPWLLTALDFRFDSYAEPLEQALKDLVSNGSVMQCSNPKLCRLKAD
jgi:hypothetical protein